MQRIKIIKDTDMKKFESSVNKFLENLYELGIDSDLIYLDNLYSDGYFICFIEWEVK